MVSPCSRNLLAGWIGCLGLLLFSGCQREADIRVYGVPKQVPYSLPDGWERVENTSAMRLATFRIQKTVKVPKRPSSPCLTFR